MALYEKKIAHIFKEEQVFLTVFGKFYRYERLDGRIKCRCMLDEEEKEFCRKLKQQDEAADWRPVARTAFNKAAVFRQLSYTK